MSTRARASLALAAMLAGSGKTLDEILGPAPQPGGNPPCPKCGGRRTWVSVDTWRCRDDGTRFAAAAHPRGGEESTQPSEEPK